MKNSLCKMREAEARVTKEPERRQQRRQKWRSREMTWNGVICKVQNANSVLALGAVGSEFMSICTGTGTVTAKQQFFCLLSRVKTYQGPT